MTTSSTLSCNLCKTELSYVNSNLGKPHLGHNSDDCVKALHQQCEALRIEVARLERLLEFDAKTIGELTDRVNSANKMPAYGYTVKPMGSFRSCEKCHGENPCLWDAIDRHYLCVKCHGNPSDPFFAGVRLLDKALL